jgi:hypothetical protein
MLKFSTLQSHISPVALSADEDRKLRRAFGRFARKQYRQDGEAVVSAHYEKHHCFHCDCHAAAPRAPRLFLVSGTHIRRETEGKGMPHAESCDFAREPHEQKKLVNSYRWQSSGDEYRFNLLRHFGDKDLPSQRRTVSATTNQSRPTLARVLCALLDRAGLDRFSSNEPLHGNREEQIVKLQEAAAFFALAPNQKLSSWFATSLRDYYDLKKRLDKKPEGWKRPHGLFIEAFDRIEDNILYPKRADIKPIPVTGKLTVFGEGENMRRPPYLVIGLLAQPRRDADTVELLNAYAHPCVAWDRLTLIDSQLERETLELLISCRDWLVTNCGIEMTVEKPLHDVGPPETEDSREICLPDFILNCRGQDIRHRRVVIETMGYNDPAYRERKSRMHALFERLGENSSTIPVIGHDRFKPGMTNMEADHHFRYAVCKTIVGRGPE